MSDMEKRIERIEQTLDTLIAWLHPNVLNKDCVDALHEMRTGTMEAK